MPAPLAREFDDTLADGRSDVGDVECRSLAGTWPCVEGHRRQDTVTEVQASLRARSNRGVGLPKPTICPT